MIKLLRAQTFVLLRSHFTWFSVAALLLMMAVSFLSAYYILPGLGVNMEQYAVALSFPNLLFRFLFKLAGTYGVLITLFYGAMAVGSEYTWGTVRLPLLLAYPRWQIALHKWLALSLNIAGALFLSCILGALIGRFGAEHLRFSATPLTTADIFVAVRTYLLLIVGLTAYLALITLLATLMRSPLLAFATGLLIFMSEVLFVDVFVAKALIGFRSYLLYFNFSSLAANMDFTSERYPTFAWRSLTIVLVYELLFLLGLIFAFNRQDIHE